MDIPDLLAKVESHAMTLGLFESVNTHEPKGAPPNGLTAAIWVDRVFPMQAASGLAATTAVLVFNVRIYSPMLAEPQDMIDPEMTAATDKLLNTYSGDFQLSGSTMSVDLLGMSGQPLTAQAGYINQDGRLYRVMTIVVPLIVADAWVQAA